MPPQSDKNLYQSGRPHFISDSLVRVLSLCCYPLHGGVEA
uniref:Uncharacterized protein n=1 Tax=Myoviridae sp. ctiil21 TaxID=2825153 RepID=A0A8S5P589_9CAUD|nr:MAG TPA: hypothetical protein [Myoviridae sp. ctiil21]